MIVQRLLIAATALSIVALPAMAQTQKAEKESTGHHYSGGPRAEPHHMGKKDTGTKTRKSGPSGSHHYSGGPREPHHIGPK